MTGAPGRPHRFPKAISGSIRRRVLLAIASVMLTVVPTAGLAISANSNLICTLVGDGAHNGTNPTGTHQPNLKLHGTDLGFSFKFRNRVMMLFGDTWIEDDFIC